LSIGLVDLVVPEDQILAVAADMAATFARRPATALAACKAAIDHGWEVDLETGLQIERSLFASLFSTPDKDTGDRSFIEHGLGRPRSALQRSMTRLPDLMKGRQARRSGRSGLPWPMVGASMSG
jgi:hypothetical protein